MFVFVNGLFTIARKYFIVTTCKKCVHFTLTKQISFVSLNKSFIYTMPPKRKQTAQVDSTKSGKEKAIEEAPSRPKRNRVITSYNEEYSDEPVKITKVKTKNAGDVKDKKDTPSKSKDVESTEVKVKGKRGRKKKVVVEQEVEEKVEDDEDEVVEETKDLKNKSEKPDEVDEEEDDEIEKDDEADEDVEDVEDVEVKVTKTKGRKKKDDDAVEEKPKKNGKGAVKKAAAAPKNKTATAYEEINFNDCTRKNENGKEWNFKISNWNVDGIRAWMNKGGLEYIQYEKPDIFCLQETKCSEDKLPPEVKEVDDYKVYWICSEKDGYAGVGLYSKVEPISVQYGLNDKEHDNEGRMITAEFEKFYVVSVYVPNSGRGLVTLPKRLKWNEAFRKFVAALDKKKPVIVCGDMNVSHLEIDLSNPKTNTKNAGFTKEERDGMTEFLSDGYVDTFRKIYPDKTQAYTFWTYMSNCRAKNIGWRLDYFIVSERFMDNVCDNIIRNQVFGSDHCPITLFLNV